MVHSLRRKMVSSVTNEEIAHYWKERRMVEEDHLCAAIKAAARLRARQLSEHGYMQFVDALKENDESEQNENSPRVFGRKYEKNNNKEIRVGIKDWWTKSKYAYLNQPALKDSPRPRSHTYLPQIFSTTPLNSKPWIIRAAYVSS